MDIAGKPAHNPQACLGSFFLHNDSLVRIVKVKERLSQKNIEKIVEEIQGKTSKQSKLIPVSVVTCHQHLLNKTIIYSRCTNTGQKRPATRKSSIQEQADWWFFFLNRDIKEVQTGTSVIKKADKYQQWHQTRAENLLVLPITCLREGWTIWGQRSPSIILHL